MTLGIIAPELWAWLRLLVRLDIVILLLALASHLFATIMWLEGGKC